jgi:hypothetical protein
MLRHCHLQPHRLAHAPTRLRLALVAGAALVCILCAGPISAAKAQPSPQTPQREQLTIPPEEAVKPWTGDLAGMIKRGRIRVLTVYSKTFYFVNKGLQRGATYDFVLALKMFHMCWALSDGSSKLIPIDEQPNHQIVHLFRLGKAQRATHEPLNPGPEIDVLALDFLRVLLAYVMLFWIDMPLVGSPAVRVKLRDAKGLQELL